MSKPSMLHMWVLLMYDMDTPPSAYLLRARRRWGDTFADELERMLTPARLTMWRIRTADRSERDLCVFAGTSCCVKATEREFLVVWDRPPYEHGKRSVLIDRDDFCEYLQSFPVRPLPYDEQRAAEMLSAGQKEQQLW